MRHRQFYCLRCTDLLSTADWKILTRPLTVNTALSTVCRPSLCVACNVALYLWTWKTKAGEHCLKSGFWIHPLLSIWLFSLLITEWATVPLKMIIGNSFHWYMVLTQNVYIFGNANIYLFSFCLIWLFEPTPAKKKWLTVVLRQLCGDRDVWNDFLLRD